VESFDMLDSVRVLSRVSGRVDSQTGRENGRIHVDMGTVDHTSGTV
jgi:hypothetical protein